MAGDEGETPRIRTALEFEELALLKAIGEINKESHHAEELAASDCKARGLLRSGIFSSKIVEIHQNRAKQIMDKYIELRRATLQTAPEAASEDKFKMLLESASETVDHVLSSIPMHLRRFGFQITADVLGKKDEFAAHALKTHGRLEIEMLKREHVLNLTQEVLVVKTEAKDKKKVWVVHGRNLGAREAMFTFLRAIGLDPMEWGQALALTGKGTPYTGEVLEQAFMQPQAVVVLITGDDIARLGTRFAEPHDAREEIDLTPQARPNVLFEAGMAFGKYPDQTVLVHLGKTRPFSDVVGRNVLHISNDIGKRQGLVDRLRTAGCEINIEHRSDWHKAGDFDTANEPPDFQS